MEIPSPCVQKTDQLKGAVVVGAMLKFGALGLKHLAVFQTCGNLLLLAFVVVAAAHAYSFLVEREHNG